MAKILVIGASGQLAQALVDRIGGFEIEAIGRDRLDIADTGRVRDAVHSLKPIGVINASAFTAVDKAESDPEPAFAINRDGPAALADACADLSIPMVHVSTDYVFDGSKPSPYLESDPKAPLGVYGRSKSEGEDAVLAATDRAAVLRTSWVYSAIGANFLKTMLRLAAAGREEVGVVDDQIGRPTYAPDLADACLASFTALRDGREAAGVYHYSGAGDATWADFAVAIFDHARELGLPAATVKRITTAEYPTPAKRPANSRLDCSKFESAFGLKTVDWRQSLAACMARIAAG